MDGGEGHPGDGPRVGARGHAAGHAPVLATLCQDPLDRRMILSLVQIGQMTIGGVW